MAKIGGDDEGISALGDEGISALHGEGISALDDEGISALEINIKTAVGPDSVKVSLIHFDPVLCAWCFFNLWLLQSRESYSVPFPAELVP